MTVIATLTVDLIAESAKFRKSLEKSSKHSRNWAKEVKQSAGIAAKSIAVMGGAAAAALGAIYAKTAPAIDATAKFSDRIGIATEELGGLRHAAELTGVASKTLDLGLQRMTRRVSEAAAGTGEAKKALAELNIDAAKLNTLSPDEQFRRIAEAMGDVDQRSDQVRLAMRLFDTEGVALVNTLDLGAQGLRTAADEAINMGVAISRIDAAKVEAANDAMTRAGLVSQGLANAITVELAPIVEAVANEFYAAAQEAGGMGEVVTRAMGAMAKAVGYGANFVRGLQFAWAAVQAAAAAAIHHAVAGIAILDRGISALLDKLPGVSAAPSEFLQTFAASSESVMRAAKDKMDAIASEPLPYDGIVEWIANVQRAATEAAAKVAQSVKPAVISPAVGAGALSGGIDGADAIQAEQSRAAQQLEAVRASLLSQEQALAESYIRRQHIVDDALARQLIGEDRHQQMSVQLTSKLEKDRKELAVTQMEDRLSAAKEMFGNLAFLANNENTKLAAIGRSAAIVQATIDGFLAAQKALAQGGPIMGPVMAASIGVMTAANIAGIAGAAHGGLTNVPGEATYLLNKNERVLSPNQNKDFTDFIDNGGAGAGNITVNINEDASKAGQVERNGNELTVFVAAAKNAVFSELENGGNQARRVEKRYGLTRRAG